MIIVLLVLYMGVFLFIFCVCGSSVLRYTAKMCYTEQIKSLLLARICISLYILFAHFTFFFYFLEKSFYLLSKVANCF